MVRTSVVVLADPGEHRGGATPGDERVNQRVAARIQIPVRPGSGRVTATGSPSYCSTALLLDGYSVHRPAVPAQHLRQPVGFVQPDREFRDADRKPR